MFFFSLLLLLLLQCEFIDRRLAIAQSRGKCYCQTSGNSKISEKLLLPDTPGLMRVVQTLELFTVLCTSMHCYYRKNENFQMKNFDIINFFGAEIWKIMYSPENPF